jgi:hypothetical protein
VGEHGRRPGWRRRYARVILAASLVALFLVAPTSAQAAREHCCFKVSVRVDGGFAYDYGSDPRNDYNGGGSYGWHWRLVTFVESGDNARGRPVLHDLGPQKGQVEFNEETFSLTKRQPGTTTHDSLACQERQGSGRFFRSNGSVSFSLAVDGHLHLVAPLNPGYNARCDHVAFGHQPTQLSGEFPDVFSGQHALAREPWSYDIAAGPRKRYRQDRNFKLELEDASSHAPDPQSNSPHEAYRRAGLRLTFTFVPRSELRKERRKLRRCKQECG